MYINFNSKGINNYKEQCFDKPQRDKNYFLLVSGDLSGVQDFIYTISSKGALKSLRARSFYLDLLLEHIADEILEKLELSRANLIYTGGGHLYMLLPNTEDVQKILDNAKESINEWFLNNFGTELYLALAYEECSSNDLMDAQRQGLTRKVFRNVSKKLSADKLHRYTDEQLRNIMDPNGKYNHIEDNTRECNVCHTSKKVVKKREGYDDLKEICDNCFNFVRMGKDLVFNSSEKEETTKIMTIRKVIPVHEESKKEKAYLELPSIDSSPKYLVLEKKWQVEKGLSNEEDIDKYVRIYTKNKWMAGLKMSTNLWMGDYNKEPEEKGSLIEFEELANNSEGIKRLAVMRADVDNLGSIFISGFDKNFGTLSRYTTLSRQLSLFFKNYINNVCKSNIKGVDGKGPNNFTITGEIKEAKKDKNLVIVYSGGDDVFIVGAWNDVIDFAVDLRKCFKVFTNNKLTFSAGIGFFSPSYPVYQMANMTGKLEEEAKAYPDRDNPSKDAIALFGLDKSVNKEGKEIDLQHVYSWEEFETSVYPKVEYFINNFRKSRQR